MIDEGRSDHRTERLMRKGIRRSHPPSGAGADPGAARQRHRSAPALDLQRRDRQAQPELRHSLRRLAAGLELSASQLIARAEEIEGEARAANKAASTSARR